MAKPAPKPRRGETPLDRTRRSKAQEEKRARDEALRSQDSPKRHGDPLLDRINPLRHVAKDLT